MDFTPAGGDAAAGDDAAAVAEGDRAALVPVEDALFGAETQDAAVVTERDALDGTGAADGHAATVRGTSLPSTCAYPAPAQRPLRGRRR